MGTVGGMTVFDVPGFNDSDVARSDKSILIETVKILRPMIKDENRGISSFIHCIMPNASHRITDTTVNSMKLILFTLNCLNWPIDL